MPTSTAGERRSRSGVTPSWSATRSRRASASASVAVTRTSQWLIEKRDVALGPPGARHALAHPAQLLDHPLLGEVGHRVGPEGPGPEGGDDAGDVTLAAGEAQHPRAATAEEERRVGPLHGLGTPRQPVDPVVGAVVVEGSRVEQALQHDDGLLEALDTHARRVEREPAAW